MEVFEQMLDAKNKAVEQVARLKVEFEQQNVFEIVLSYFQNTIIQIINKIKKSIVQFPPVQVPVCLWR